MPSFRRSLRWGVGARHSTQLRVDGGVCVDRLFDNSCLHLKPVSPCTFATLAPTKMLMLLHPASAQVRRQSCHSYSSSVHFVNCFCRCRAAP